MAAGVDWPIAYDELEPFYGEAESEIGVSGDSAEPLGSPRSAAYPMPPIPQTFLDKAYARALAGTQFEVRADAAGRAIRSSATTGPPAAAMRAASRSARSRPSTTRPCMSLAAEKRGRGPPCRRPRRRRRGRRGRARSPPSASSAGTAARAWRRGKVFVLAAHAIETPRLLLHSRSEARPNGVANSSDQVGRNLMDHPTQLSWALAPEPVWPYRGPLSTSGIENLRDGAFPQGAAGRSASRSATTAGRGRPARRSTTAAEFGEQGLRGAALDSALRDQASRHIRLASLVEQLPDPENRVTLDPNETRHLRRAAAAHRLPPRRLCRRPGWPRLATRMQRSSARSARPRSSIATAPEGAGHIIGTARMGDDPKTSVVDRDLRSHDHRQPVHPRLGRVPDLGDRQPDAHHRGAEPARGRSGEGNDWRE